MIQSAKILLASFLLTTFACATRVMGASGGFFSRYNLGVTYEASTSNAQISYDAPLNGALPEDCDVEGAGQMRCTAYLAPESDDTPTPSIFLQRPFVRQGLLYFDYGLTFSTVTYKGGIVPKPKRVTTTGKTGPAPREALPAPGVASQPLERAFLELYGINWQTYLRFGLTPRYLPDLLLTTGLGLQTVAGRVKIFAEDGVRAFVQPAAFAEAELVVLRAYTGSLSAFVGQDQSLLMRSGTSPVEDNPSGTALTDFSLGLSTATAGVRLLLPF